MKILEKIKDVFRYPIDMEEKIIKHEERTLKVYSKIIDDNYRAFFENLGMTLDVNLIWNYISMKKWSRNRIAFYPTYSCSVYCEIKKNGNIVKIPSQDGEVDYYPLWAVWEISRIDFSFNIHPYLLFNDIDDIYEEMNELKELLLEEKRFQESSDKCCNQ